MDRCKIIHTPSYNQEDVASHCVEAVAAKQQRSNPHFSVFLKTDFPLYSQIDQQYFFVGPNTASYVCGVWEVTPMKPTQRGQVQKCPQQGFHLQLSCEEAALKQFKDTNNYLIILQIKH